MANNKQNRRDHGKGSTRRAQSVSDNSAGFLRCILFGTAVGMMATGILLPIAAFIIMSSSDIHAMITPASLAVMYISSAASGFAAVKSSRSRALICAIGSGSMLLLIMLLLSLLLKGDATHSFGMPISVLLRLLTPIFSFIGGYIATRKRSTTHKKRRR